MTSRSSTAPNSTTGPSRMKTCALVSSTLTAATVAAQRCRQCRDEVEPCRDVGVVDRLADDDRPALGAHQRQTAQARGTIGARRHRERPDAAGARRRRRPAGATKAAGRGGAGVGLSLEARVSATSVAWRSCPTRSRRAARGRDPRWTATYQVAVAEEQRRRLVLGEPDAQRVGEVAVDVRRRRRTGTATASSRTSPAPIVNRFSPDEACLEQTLHLTLRQPPLPAHHDAAHGEAVGRPSPEVERRRDRHDERHEKDGGERRASAVRGSRGGHPGAGRSPPPSAATSSSPARKTSPAPIVRTRSPGRTRLSRWRTTSAIRGRYQTGPPGRSAR